jgi:hypothetical protein
MAATAARDRRRASSGRTTNNLAVRRDSLPGERKLKYQGNNGKAHAYYQMKAKFKRTFRMSQNSENAYCAKQRKEDECSPVRQFDSFLSMPRSALEPYFS